MRIVKRHAFGPVQGYELGYSPIGRPFMTVYLYVVGSVMIDTGQSHMWGRVLEIASHRTLDSLLLTHHHEDHSGNAKRIADRIKYFRVDENIAEEIRSIKKVVALDFDAVFCSHYPKAKGGKTRLKRKLQFLEDLYGNVASLRNRGHSAAEIMKILKIKEATRVKWFCLGNVSAVNGVRSIVKSLPK